MGLFSLTKVRVGPNKNPLQWWYRYAKRYSSITQLVRDVMGIQASSVAAECAFLLLQNLLMTIASVLMMIQLPL